MSSAVEDAQNATQLFADEEKWTDTFTCRVLQVPPGKDAVEIYKLGSLITFNFSWKYPAAWWLTNDALFKSKVNLSFYPAGLVKITRPANTTPQLFIPCVPRPNGAPWKLSDYTPKVLASPMFPGFVVTTVSSTGTGIKVLGDLINHLHNLSLSDAQRGPDSIPEDEVQPKAQSQSQLVAENEDLRMELKGMKTYINGCIEEQSLVNERIERLDERVRLMEATDVDFKTAVKSVESLNEEHEKMVARMDLFSEAIKKLNEVHTAQTADYERLQSEVETVADSVEKNQKEMSLLKKNLSLNFFELRSDIAELKKKARKLTITMN